MTPPLGLLVLNLGGPRTLEDVKRFLGTLFADREIIKFPGGRPGQWILSRIIVAARLRSVKQNYRSIGGGSPILRYTESQVAGAADRLAGRLDRLVRPYIAFRYTAPTSDEALARMVADGIAEVVVLTLYPHYSIATTGSSLNELKRAVERTPGADRLRFRVVDRWYDHPSYLEVLTSRVRNALETWPESERKEVYLLFSAHSLPLSLVEEGDPYSEHIRTTMEGILARLDREAPIRHGLAYQSQTGPVKWLEPRTDRVVEELGRDGVKKVLVVPLSFVSDHIETLYEVDQLFGDAAAESGIEEFRRTESLNDDPSFLDALADVVETALERDLVSDLR